MQFQMILKILFLFMLLNISAHAMFEEHNKCSWEEKKTMPTPRSEFSTSTHEKNIYVLGGIAGKNALNNFEVYNTLKDEWKIIAPLPIKVHHGAIGILENKLYLIGGFKDITWQKPNNSIFEYSPYFFIID